MPNPLIVLFGNSIIFRFVTEIENTIQAKTTIPEASKSQETGQRSTDNQNPTQVLPDARQSSKKPWETTKYVRNSHTGQGSRHEQMVKMHKRVA